MQTAQSTTALPWLTQLDILVAQLSEQQGRPWLSWQYLEAEYYARYSESLTALAQHYQLPFRTLLAQSGRFAIYNASITGDFYVARHATVNPYRACGKQRAASKQGMAAARAPEVPPLPAALESDRQLATALDSLYQQLARASADPSISIATLSRAFYQHYREPLRSCLRRLQIPMSLAEFLARNGLQGIDPEQL